MAAARKLIAYLTTPGAQQAWIRRPGSGAISVNRLVPPGDYPDRSRASWPPSHHGGQRPLRRLRLHAAGLESAFNNAVLEYLDSPGQLNVILHGLDQAQKAAY